MSGGKTAIFSLTLFLAAAGPAAAQHKVFGVAANDVLNIRSAPNADATIVARIPPNGRGIRIVGGGNKFWVKVSYGGTTGFVNRRFIRRDSVAAASPSGRQNIASVSSDPLDEAYAGPAPAGSASVIVQPEALPAAIPESAKPKQSLPRADGAPKKNNRAPAMTLESGPALPASSSAVAMVPEATVLAAPAVQAPDADSAPTTLVAPPKEMMTQALPSAITCTGDKPGWSLNIANGVSTFQSGVQQDVLEFGELKQSSAQSDVWMAGGRNFASQLSLHIHQTGTCKSGTGASTSPYDVSLRLNDGRVLTGCCRGAN